MLIFQLIVQKITVNTQVEDGRAEVNTEVKSLKERKNDFSLFSFFITFVLCPPPLIGVPFN